MRSLRAQAAQPSSSPPVREAVSGWPHRRPSPPRSLSARGCSCSRSLLLKVRLHSGTLALLLLVYRNVASLWLPDAERSLEDPVCLEELVRSSTLPHRSPHTLQAAMQLVNIQMLAFTPPHTLPWRVYLYTHAQRAHSRSTLILGELLWPGERHPSETPAESRRAGGEDVRVTLKQQPRDEEALQGFFSILTTVLQTLSSQD